MLLHVTQTTEATAFQPERETLFEFDTAEITAYLRQHISHLEQTRSPHKIVGEEQRKYIDYLQQWLVTIQNVMSSRSVNVLTWDVSPALNEPAHRLFLEVLQNGYGSCLCSQCQEVYLVSNMEVLQEIGGEMGSDFLNCPRGHCAGVAFRLHAGVIGLKYPKPHERRYVIGKDGNRPRSASVDDF